MKGFYGALYYMTLLMGLGFILYDTVNGLGSCN